MKRYKFQFIARQGQVALVQVVRGGVTERCTLPIDIIIASENELTGAQLDAGIPYGLLFEEFLPSGSEVALHNAGIWTLNDLCVKAQTAVCALSSVGLHLTDVIELTEAYLKQDHTVVSKVAKSTHKKKVNKEI
jgi:hypothetical protein